MRASPPSGKFEAGDGRAATAAPASERSASSAAMINWSRKEWRTGKGKRKRARLSPRPSLCLLSLFFDLEHVPQADREALRVATRPEPRQRAPATARAAAVGELVVVDLRVDDLRERAAREVVLPGERVHVAIRLVGAGSRALLGMLVLI